MIRSNPYSMHGDKRERAKSLLWHYLHVIAHRAGVEASLDRDTDHEIGDIIDCILDAAVEHNHELPQ